MTEEDVTGRSRIARNVGASYAGHLVFVIFGFITPRVIDEQIGQEALGIWDFSWSLVHYLNLTMVGIGSSVNRYVARYRAAGDTSSLSRTISTVVAVQLAIAAIVLGASVILAYQVPIQFAERLGDLGTTAGWVIGLLGSSLAVQFAFDAWRGVLTGCHRWDYYNALNAGGYGITASIMLGVLLTGGGLQDIARVYLLSTIATEVVRYWVARRICPEIELRITSVNIQDAKKVVRFGLKTILLAFPAIVTIQTVNILVVANLGPAALAMLARPLALVSHITSLASKYAYVLTPAAGSLLIVFFTVGDLIIDLWMGPGYSDWGTSAMLAAGFLMPISQGPILKVMAGLNQHGRIALASIGVTFTLLIVGLLSVSYVGWSIRSAAALIAMPIGLGTGATCLYYGFTHLKLGLSDYYHKVLRDGLVLLALLSAVLFTFRWFSPFAPLVTLGASAVLTAVIVYVVLREDFSRIHRALREAPATPSS